MQQEKHLNIRKSVLMSWIISYIFILLIPLVISSIVYMKSMSIIEKQVTDSNTSMLMQLQSELDGHLQDIENLSLRINGPANGNTNLYSLMRSKDEQEIIGNYSNVKKMMDMNDEFNNYTLSDSFIKSFYIFFKNKDLVWTELHLSDKKSFYDKKIDQVNMDYDKWIELMNQKSINKYSSFYVKEGNEDSIKTIAFMQSLPINVPSDMATLVVTMDEKRINNAFRNISNANNSFVYIIDKNDDVLYNSSNKESASYLIKYNDMDKNMGIISNAGNGKDVVISYISSQVTDWKYVCVIPKSVFREKVEYVRNLTAICLTICIVVGTMAIIWFAKRNYNPINELVRNLKDKFGENSSKEGNEFSFIQNSIYNVYNEKEIISEKLKQQNDTIRVDFIARLIKGKFDGKIPDSNILDSYGIHFDSKIFIVLVFYIENSSMVILDGVEENKQNSVKDFRNIIFEGVKDLIGNGYNLYASDLEDMITCIVNIENEKINNWRSDIDAMIIILREKTKLDFVVSISGLNENISGIHKAYKESMETMEYRLFNSYSRTIYHDDIKLLEQKSYNYFYSIEDEQKLINNIKIGDFEKAQEIVENVLQENFSTRMVSIHMAKCVMFDLISTFIKAVNSENILNESKFLEDKNLVQRLLTFETLDDMKFEISNYLKDVCEYMLENGQHKSKNGIVDKINSIIENRYFDENLNVSTLADEVGMNSKYISALYKENTGESIIEFISKIRIEKAKVLLKEEASIVDTARKVGFSNSNALIRAFKKYEGITPGQFKELDENNNRTF